MTVMGCRTSCCLHPYKSNTEITSPSFPDSHTSRVLISPLPAAVQIASLLHTILSISSQCQLKTKHSFKCIRWERKEQKKQSFLVCNKMQNVLQRGLVPCSFFPGTLKPRRDESQSLIFNSGTGSPLERGCLNIALISFLEQIKATMDRKLYIHVFFVSFK